MRIIGGLRRGLLLRGEVPPGVRPTSDRAREGLFMVLTKGSWGWGEVGGVRFADMCAGVGSVGLEALSRGVGEVVFVEKEPSEGLRANIRAMNLSGWRLVKGDVLNLGREERGFDVVFMDPPYGWSYYGQAIEHGRERGWLREGSRFIVEVDKKEASSCEEVLRKSYLGSVERRGYGRNVFVSGVVLS